MASRDPLTTPALPPPPGVTSNFIDPPMRAPFTYTIAYVLFGLITAGVAARIYTKAFVMRKLHLDDYALILGWLGVLSFLILSAMMEPFVGRHAWDINQASLPHFFYIFEAIQLSYLPPMLFLKLAILLQLTRIFTTPRYSLSWLSYQALIWSNVVFFTTIFLFTIFRCVPRSKLLDHNVPGVCFNYVAMLTATSGFNALVDLVMLGLPIWRIWRLAIGGGRKWGLSAVFAVGALGCLSSLLRVYYTIILIHTPDLTWNVLPVGFTAMIEFASAQLVAFLPVMPAFYQHVVRHLPFLNRKNRNRDRLVGRSPRLGGGQGNGPGEGQGGREMGMIMGYSAVAFAGGEEEWGRRRLESERSLSGSGTGSFESLRGEGLGVGTVRRPEVAVVKGRVEVVETGLEGSGKVEGIREEMRDGKSRRAVAKMPANVVMEEKGKRDEAREVRREIRRPDTPIIREIGERDADGLRERDGREWTISSSRDSRAGEIIRGDGRRLKKTVITGKRVR